MGVQFYGWTRYEILNCLDPDEQQMKAILDKLNCCMSLTKLDIWCDACRIHLISEDRYGSGRVLFEYWDDDKFTGRGGVLIDPSIPDDDEWAEWQIELDDGGGPIYPTLRETVSREVAIETALRIIKLGYLPPDVILIARPMFW